MLAAERPSRRAFRGTTQSHRLRCSASAHADTQRVDELLRLAGATTSLRVGDGPLGRGLFASVAAQPGEVLLTVPLPTALAASTGGSRETVAGLLRAARAAGLPRALGEAVEDRRVPAAHRLAAWLLWAVEHDPLWTCAAALLPPRDFRVALATAEAPAAAGALGAHGSPEALAWALSCVHSRTFGADAWTRGDRDGVLGLCLPVADLLNHRAPPAHSTSTREPDPPRTQASSRTASSGCAPRRASSRCLRGCPSQPARRR